MDFDKSLKPTETVCYYLGINIFAPKDRLGALLDYFLFYFIAFWILRDIAAEFLWIVEGIHLQRTFNEMSLVAPCATVSILSLAKAIFFYLNRNIIREVIQQLKEMHPEGENSEVHNENNEKSTNIYDQDIIEKNIVKKSLRNLNIVVTMFLYACIFTVVAFACTPFLAMAYEYYEDKEFTLKLMFYAKYHLFDGLDINVWPYVYAHQFMSASFVGAGVLAVDTMFYWACTIVEMHFQILYSRFETVVSGDASTTNARMITAIRMHQSIISVVDKLNAIFPMSLLSNVLVSSVLICLSAFVATTHDDIGAVAAFILLLTFAVVQIFLICFFGDMIGTSSISIGDSIHNSYWYNAEKNVKKAVLLILIRSHKPCKLHAAQFAAMNLRAFTKILSRSWSYFALLKSVYK